jgi:hypothetical protein
VKRTTERKALEFSEGMTVKFNREIMLALRQIADRERRSVGFLVRDAVVFWLADYLRRETGVTETVRSLVRPSLQRLEDTTLKVDTSTTEGRAIQKKLDAWRKR